MKSKGKIKSAVESAERDFKAGLKPSATRHDALVNLTWADWYHRRYKDLAEAADRPRVNSTEAVIHFLSFHPRLTVSIEDQGLTALEAQATLALSKYASSTFDVSLTGDMIVLTEKE